MAAVVVLLPSAPQGRLVATRRKPVVGEGRPFFSCRCSEPRRGDCPSFPPPLRGLEKGETCAAGRGLPRAPPVATILRAFGTLREWTIAITA